MENFGLVSVDWDSVRILDAAHLRAETAYHEERVRWHLRYAGRHGVVAIRQDSVTLALDGSVVIQRLSAVTPNGRIIEIGDNQPLRGIIDIQGRDEVDVFVGVSIGHAREDRERVPLRPSADAGLIGAHGLQTSYKVGTAPIPGYDSIAIAGLRRTERGFIHRDDFAPECWCLASHWLLLRDVGEIEKAAKNAANTLAMTEWASEGLRGWAIGIASSLAHACQCLDMWSSPAAYVDRMAAVTAALGIQLNCIPRDLSGPLAQVLSKLAETNDYLRGGAWTAHTALQKVAECLQALPNVWPVLNNPSVSSPTKRTAPDYLKVR